MIEIERVGVWYNLARFIQEQFARMQMWPERARVDGLDIDRGLTALTSDMSVVLNEHPAKTATCPLCSGLRVLPNFLDAPGGPRCACGRPSTRESGACSTVHGAVACPRCGTVKYETPRAPVFLPMHMVVPEGRSGSVGIEHFDDRGVRRCRLRIGNVYMMSDSTFEHATNEEIVRRAHGRVLIAGLGLGMILWPIAAKPEVTEIVVVEKSPDVLKLVATTVPAKVKLINASIHSWRPGDDERFNVVWFDIEAHNTLHSLRAEVSTLFRTFLPYLAAREVDPARWMNSWQRTAIREQRRQAAEARR